MGIILTQKIWSYMPEIISQREKWKMNIKTSDWRVSRGEVQKVDPKKRNKRCPSQVESWSGRVDRVIGLFYTLYWERQRKWICLISSLFESLELNEIKLFSPSVKFAPCVCVCVQNCLFLNLAVFNSSFNYLTVNLIVICGTRFLFVECLLAVL